MGGTSALRHPLEGTGCLGGAPRSGLRSRWAADALVGDIELIG